MMLLTDEIAVWNVVIYLEAFLFDLNGQFTQKVSNTIN